MLYHLGKSFLMVLSHLSTEKEGTDDKDETGQVPAAPTVGKEQHDASWD